MTIRGRIRRWRWLLSARLSELSWLPGADWLEERVCPWWGEQP